MAAKTDQDRALDSLSINTIRFLAVDMVQESNSGHPGMPMGAAPMAYTLWTRFLKFNPRDPQWPDRDRFVLSAGHGCALLYSLLHLTGYDLSLEDLKQFRQWGSRTPGHPEYGLTPGVEATTGPLGQGFGNAVGMAMAEAALAARYNRPDINLVNHFTYAIVSDGDLMEGVSSEAASLAGHLKLGRLIVLYDDNHISIEGNTQLAFTEDRVARFAAYQWHTQQVEDGNDTQAIETAIKAAREVKDRPSFIAVRTHIGFGSPHKQDTASAHGEALGEKEVRLTKENLGWPTEPAFHVPSEVLHHFRKAVDRGAVAQDEWKALCATYATKYPALSSAFLRTIRGALPDGWKQGIPAFKPEDGPVATRVASGKTVDSLAPHLPELIGGSADLAPSTHTLMKDGGDFEPGDFTGRNLHFGVREHSMGAILNGIALHKGFLPYGATFLIFSDYMRPPMRLAAMTGLRVIYLFTHDSLGLGEDGPTHQPVEQLLGLRSVPGLTIIRPADANETAAAWQVAIQHEKGPVAMALTRQKVPVLDTARYPGMVDGVARGGYTLADAGDGASRKRGVKPDLILIATGSEVHLALQARERLETEGIRTRVVSMPCWEIYRDQPDDYRSQLLPMDVPMLAVEAGVSLGWQNYLGTGVASVSVDQFGASAQGTTVLEQYGFNVDNLFRRAMDLVKEPGRNRAKRTEKEAA